MSVVCVGGPAHISKRSLSVPAQITPARRQHWNWYKHISDTKSITVYTDSYLLQLWWVMMMMISLQTHAGDKNTQETAQHRFSFRFTNNLKEVHILLKLNDKNCVPKCKFWKILKKFSMIFLGTSINVFFFLRRKSKDLVFSDYMQFLPKSRKSAQS